MNSMRFCSVAHPRPLKWSIFECQGESFLGACCCPERHRGLRKQTKAKTRRRGGWKVDYLDGRCWWNDNENEPANDRTYIQTNRNVELHAIPVLKYPKIRSKTEKKIKQMKNWKEKHIYSKRQKIIKYLSQSQLKLIFYILRDSGTFSIEGELHSLVHPAAAAADAEAAHGWLTGCFSAVGVVFVVIFHSTKIYRLH